MTTLTLIGFGIGGFLLWAFAEAAFDVLFGHIGARVMLIVTFGRVRLDPLEGGESVLATWIGVVVTIFLVIGICSVVQRH